MILPATLRWVAVILFYHVIHKVALLTEPFSLAEYLWSDYEV